MEREGERRRRRRHERKGGLEIVLFWGKAKGEVRRRFNMEPPPISALD